MSRAVEDMYGVTHRVHSRPEPFTTIAGGLPGETRCGVLFYADELGPESCTLTGHREHSYARPMSRTGKPVSCMTCLVRECR